MNIIEALKSGKRFRRKNSSPWYVLDGSIVWNHYDILADDWELEETYYPVTESELGELMIRVSQEGYSSEKLETLLSRIKSRDPVKVST